MSPTAAGAPGDAARTPEQWGPTHTGGSGRRRWPWVLLVLLLAVLLAWGGAGAWGLSQIQRTQVEGLQGGGGPLHLLVVGSDSRAGLTPEQQRDLSTGSAGGERTDTIFLMTIDGGRVGLLAFPRDLWVRRCDGAEQRINTAQAVGGPGCLVQTVSDLSGIPIDHYLSVDFLGFRNIVRAVGGVRMCLEQPIEDDDAGIDLPAGCQRLSGREALGYVRVRKIDSDLERIQRQQRFLGALADAVLAPGTLLHVPRLYTTAGAAGSALRADTGLGPVDLARVAWGVRGLAGGGAVLRTVPTTPVTTAEGAQVLEPTDEAAALYAGFRDGSILAEAGTAPDRADVSVRVLNGTDVPDLAARTAEQLRSAGYRVAGIGNAPATGEGTVVRHPPGAAAAAGLVAGDLPVDPTVVESEDVGGVTVVLGADLR